MRDVLEHQFPKASTEARNKLFIQLSLLNNTLYELTELTQGNFDSMVGIGAFDHIPTPKDIYVETLMKLSEGM